MSQYVQEAAAIWQRFSKLPGSQHIASAHAIAGMLKLFAKRRPKNVLEVGAGIGTMTYAIHHGLKRLHGAGGYRFVTLEPNDFCLGQLHANLEKELSEIELHTQVPQTWDGIEPFDIIVIDGGNQDPQLVSHLAPRGVIFIEGFMDKKHTLIDQVHRDRRFVKANFRSLDRKCGYWLLFFEPTASEVAYFKVVDFYNRVRSKLKRLTQGK